MAGPISTYAEAVEQAPDDTVGHPIGYDDWRIAVQMLLPSSTLSRWGIGRWGAQRWSFLQWADLTEFVRGAEWTRGAFAFAGRPESGTAQITLDNAADRFSPANYGPSSFQGVTVSVDGRLRNSFFGPGSLVRVVAFSPTWAGPAEDRWVPQFTGIVTSWEEETAGVGAERLVNVSLVETIATLARVDNNALAGVVGNDDLPGARVQRLADAAGWPFGHLDEFEYLDLITGAPGGPTAPYQLQSTDMANNRLSEIFLTADSVGAVVRSDRSGRLAIYNQPPTGKPVRGPIGTLAAGARWGTALWNVARWPGEGFKGLAPAATGVPGGIYTVAYVADSLTTANDDEAIVNTVAYARVGSTQQTADDEVSQRRYGQVSSTRGDLINKSDPLTLRLAEQQILHRSTLTYRASAAELHNLHPNSTPAIISLDVHSAIKVTAATDPPLVVDQAVVDNLTHRLTPLNTATVVWTCTIQFGLQSALYTL